MSRSRAFFTHFTVIALIALSAPAAAAPEALMRYGNKIVTVAGQCEVRLKGVDVPGLEWSNTGDGPTSANKNLTSVQRAVNDWSCNFIRLPLNQARWMGNACGANAGSYRALVQQIVDWCNTNNVYVLLDLHWSDTGVIGGGSICTAGQHDLPDDNSLLFWQDVASTVGIANNPAVLFDLYNEPGGAKLSSALQDNPYSWALWRDGGTVPATSDGTAYHSPGMQGLLMGIRGAGANNLVLAGGIDWAFSLKGITAYGAALTDTAQGQGVAYATHIYPFKWGGNGCVVAACFDSAVPAAVMNTYPVVVTEFGPNVGDPEGFLAPLLAWINLHGLGFSAWSFHPGASPCLISDFAFTPTSYFGTPFLNQLQSTNPLGCNPPTNTPSPTVSATPTALPSCGDVVLYRINCGGGAVTDSNGDLWSADSHFSGGTPSSTTITVGGTTDPVLFRTNRWADPVTYTFSVPNGNYLVTILQSENYWGAAGARSFNILIQGAVVASNLDVFAAAGGKFQALTLTYTTTVSNGTLTVSGDASVDNAQFAGIIITRQGAACTATPTPYAGTPTETPTITPSPTATATPTMNIFNTAGPLRILAAQAVPNPSPAFLSLMLSRDADSAKVEVFSTGFSQVLEWKQERLIGGYNNVALPPGWKGLPNGVYFVSVRAKGGGEESPPKLFKMMKLR